ncbi:RagB/SusD family nutrient uptake outer membrane protein [Solitalea lacus]|uniref:RagB/SusD family nutrient uptake outer membrane protein n=1 Tax=Solitalea lacus TaxID=2911172 RepID=UPI001EDBEF20|nr:RagB/SusD family nutrient uptake outer membrane protein [Solitalea lacus]UKJ07487.1 RagB/SusD family nutrient uptake outer membrane protein [Solitalea lacus]
MRAKNIKYLVTIGAIVFSLSACEKTFDPSTAIDENSALTTAADIETATIGTYAVLRNPLYVRSLHFLMELPGDELAQGQNSSDDLSRCYRYTHLTTGRHAADFWGQAYKVAAAANKVIAAIPDNATADLKQLKGENLYLRAMVHFNLVRVFGRPYTQGETNLGVPILKDGLTEEETLTLARSTVKEVYDFVIADLEKAANFMNGGEAGKANPFASKEVAQALLSRVYLYKGDNQNAIKYADLVINSGRYELLQGSEYQNYFKGAPEGNKETIFCIRHMKTQDQGWSGLGSMYYSGDANGNAQNQAFSGWGEIYASKKYVNKLAENPGDRRNSFIVPYTVNGVLQTNKKVTPNVPMNYMIKYNLQENLVNLSSPVYLRLAEIYLNRAEANAKLGNAQAALDDVNIIRTRAGIPGHTLASVATSGKTILDVVLDERWLELAFEGHRHYDLFRNNLPMIRNYPGTHSLDAGGNINQTVEPSANRVVFFIPQTEIDKNKKLIQNP